MSNECAHDQSFAPNHLNWMQVVICQTIMQLRHEPSLSRIHPHGGQQTNDHCHPVSGRSSMMLARRPWARSSHSLPDERRAAVKVRSPCPPAWVSSQYAIARQFSARHRTARRIATLALPITRHGAEGEMRQAHFVLGFFEVRFGRIMMCLSPDRLTSKSPVLSARALSFVCP